jgi:multiple antibiotic resistance protein
MLAAICAASLVIFGVFYCGRRIIKVLGLSGIRVLTRLMGLLLSVIAIQFMVDGVQALKLTG